MNTDLDTLKTCWQNINCSPAADSDWNASRFEPRRLTSGIAKMARIYRINVGLCLAWIPLSGIMALGNNVFPIWLVVAMAAYFAVMAFMSYIVLNQIRDIDPGRMSIVEMLKAVYRLQHTRVVHKVIGLSLCLPLLACLLSVFFRHNEIMFAGGIIGAIFGLVIGLMVDSGVRRQIRIIRSELESSQSIDETGKP